MSDTVTLALAGDTMLGRGVAEQLVRDGPYTTFAPEVRAVAAEADLFVLNLECCISERGSPWPDPGKPFFFRAPPTAVDALGSLGVDCVTLANNHALDYGEEALLDTRDHLAEAGIEAVGAGADIAEARAAAILEAGGVRVGVIGVTDHPEDFAAAPGRPGVAHADLRDGVPAWLAEQIRELRKITSVVLVTPHWGPNMVGEPVRHVRAAAPMLLEAGATLVAGHSAHVFQAVAGPVLYDLGDFVDDYAIHPLLRNDLGLLFLVTADRHGPTRLEAVPLALDYRHTRLVGEEHEWITDRFIGACRAAGTVAVKEGGRLVVEWPR
ncbi:MAG: CapA family protein [Streptosporangiales bacterium]|nr:CapA family protein [Streptosporangiales bacterium]